MLSPLRTKAFAVLTTGLLLGSALLGGGLLPVAGARPAGHGAPAQPTLFPYPALTTEDSVELRGEASGKWLEISGPAGTFQIPLKSRSFSVQVPLVEDHVNRIYVTAIRGGRRSPAAIARVTQDVEPPLVYLDYPNPKMSLEGLTKVDVAGRVGDRLCGYLGIDVSVNGVPALVHVGVGPNGTFYAKDVPLYPPDQLGAVIGAGGGPTIVGGGVGGPPAITVSATDRAGNTEEITVGMRIAATQPVLQRPDGEVFGRIEVASGAGQTGQVGSTLGAPIVVRVVDTGGNPLPGKLVTFEVRRSNGKLAPTSGGGGSILFQAFTDGSGLARAFWTLGFDAGAANNIVLARSKDIVGPVLFVASATPMPPTQINLSAGSTQVVQLGGTASEPLRAWVNDACNGSGGIPVTFTVTRGDGTVGGSSQTVVLTNPTGYAQVVFDMGTTVGNNTVEATFPGNPGLPVAFSLTGVAASEPTTTFSGIIFDNALHTVEGATISLTVAGTPLPSVQTGPDGRFEVPGISVFGPGQAKVDGSTATALGGLGGGPIPPGSFPFLVYCVEIIQNAANELPAPVFLPPLDPANEVVYDGSSAVTLTVPGVDGLRMEVAFGTKVTLPDGTVVGPGLGQSVTLSLNQVHHDEVPMPMIDGASPPFAWTTQPGGATFDPPLLVAYPNLSGLESGAITNFLRFDHDLGEFAFFGTGLVADDAAVIISDPGVGLQEAGWGGNCPPYGIIADCEFCDEVCTDNGTLTAAGAIDVSDEIVCIGPSAQIVFTAPNVTDSGGTKQVFCVDGATSEAIPAAATAYAWDVTKDGAPFQSGTGQVATISTTVEGVYAITYTMSADRDCPPADLLLGPATGTAVKLELTKVGPTSIEGANNYSENCTLMAKVTPDPGVPLKARFLERTGTAYYDGANGATDLTNPAANTVPMAAGEAQIVVKSVSNADVIAGPADASIEVELLDAADSVLCTSSPLVVDQWVDEDSDGMYDWLDDQASALLACFVARPGEVGVVASAVTSIGQDNDGGCGETAIMSTEILISPVCGTPGNRHRLNVAHELSDTVIHESRHAWVHQELARNDVGVDDDANPGTPSNDDDGDLWPEVAGGFADANDILEAVSPSGSDGTADPDPGPQQETDAADFATAHNSECP